MTIDEAITDLSIQMEVKRRTRNDRQADAIKLGIEALKRCRTLAQNNPLWAAKPLPGETKE